MQKKACVLVLVLVSAVGCSSGVIEERASIVDQAVVTSLCPVGSDAPVIGGACRYEVNGGLSLQLRDAPKVAVGTLGGVVAHGRRVDCAVTFPKGSESSCTAGLAGFVGDEAAKAVCGKNKTVSTCPQSISVNLSETTLRFQEFVLDLELEDLPKDQIPGLLAKKCADSLKPTRIADGPVDQGPSPDDHPTAIEACRSLGSLLELKAGTPACLDEGQVTTTDGKCATRDPIEATCCIAKGTLPPVPQPMPGAVAR